MQWANATKRSSLSTTLFDFLKENCHDYPDNPRPAQRRWNRPPRQECNSGRPPPRPIYWSLLFGLSSGDIKLDTSQSLEQSQSVVNNNGNNARLCPVSA